MTTNRRQHWLEAASQHLEKLYKEAASMHADDDYTAPTGGALRSAFAFLRQHQSADKPSIAITQDGEIVFNWHHADDKFKALIRADGSVALYQNKKPVDAAMFAHRLTTVPA